MMVLSLQEAEKIKEELKQLKVRELIYELERRWETVIETHPRTTENRKANDILSLVENEIARRLGQWNG